jgi:hypothetical protein
MSRRLFYRGAFFDEGEEVGYERYVCTLCL